MDTKGVPFQYIGIDFSIIVIQSKYTHRYKQLIGLNSEMCYCMIMDRVTGIVAGTTTVTKIPPVQWIGRFLASHAPDKITTKDMICCVDRGEVGHYHEARRLIEMYGYRIILTSPESFYQNGSTEVCHRSNGRALRAMLHRSGLPWRYWPYVLRYLWRIENVTVHKSQTKTPHELLCGRKPNLSELKNIWLSIIGSRSRKKDQQEVISLGKISVSRI